MLAIEGTAEAVIASEAYLARPGMAEGGIILPEPEIVEEQRELRILPPDHHLERAIRPAPRGNATSGTIRSAASGLIKKQSPRPRGEAAFDTKITPFRPAAKATPSTSPASVSAVLQPHDCVRPPRQSRVRKKKCCLPFPTC